MPGVRNPAAERAESDGIVVGGGLFGAWLALTLARERGARVTLVEREQGLLQRASYRNQARVHNGYHYPRSILTGLRSRVNSGRFLREYAECVDTGFTQLYAVARQRSNVTAAQFRTFCERIGAPLAPAPKELAQLFDMDRIEAVWRTEEWAFDAAKLGARLAAELADAGVPVLHGHTAESVRANTDGAKRLALDVAGPGGERRELRAEFVFNCTYSALNGLVTRSGLPKIALKQELAEIALVRLPRVLDRVGVTVMCGPFFSFMPFPARGLSSFSHVRYTPHHAWFDREQEFDNAAYFAALRPRTQFLAMVKDSARYVPAVADTEYVESLFELKTVLPQSEHDDSRPILFYRHAELPGLVSVLGSKIDNVYDLERELDVLLARGRVA